MTNMFTARFATLTVATFFLIALSLSVSAQKVDKATQLEGKMKVAEDKLDKAQAKVDAADSLITVGKSMMQEGKQEMKEIQAWKNTNVEVMSKL